MNTTTINATNSKQLALEIYHNLINSIQFDLPLLDDLDGEVDLNNVKSVLNYLHLNDQLSKGETAPLLSSGNRGDSSGEPAAGMNRSDHNSVNFSLQDNLKVSLVNFKAPLNSGGGPNLSTSNASSRAQNHANDNKSSLGNFNDSFEPVSTSLSDAAAQDSSLFSNINSLAGALVTTLSNVKSSQITEIKNTSITTPNLMNVNNSNLGQHNNFEKVVKSNLNLDFNKLDFEYNKRNYTIDNRSNFNSFLPPNLQNMDFKNKQFKDHLNEESFDSSLTHNNQLRNLSELDPNNSLVFVMSNNGSSLDNLLNFSHFNKFVNQLISTYTGLINKISNLGPDQGLLTSVLLEVINTIDVSVQRELSALILINKLNFFNDLVQLKSMNISHYNKTLIDEIINSIGDILLPKYHKVFLKNTKILPTKMIHYQFFPQYPSALSNSINFILQLLENGVDLIYLSLPSLSSNLFLSNRLILRTIKKNLLKFYSTFNRDSNKLSVLTTLFYENYLISVKLLNNFTSVPATLVENFKSFKLPPLPKSNLTEPENSYLNSVNQAHDLLTFSRIYCLESLNLVVLNELVCVGEMNEYSSGTIDSKISNCVIHSLLGSLCLALISNRGKEKIFTECMNEVVYSIIVKLMKFESQTVNYSTVWISLLSLVDEFCQWDFSSAVYFIKMYDYLSVNDMIRSKSVEEAVKSFMNTYYNNEPCLSNLIEYVDNTSLTFKEVTFEELQQKFGEPEPPVEHLSKVSETSYNAGVARRQSIHVDEYERNRSFN